jgi:hypothetical protein
VKAPIHIGDVLELEDGPHVVVTVVPAVGGSHPSPGHIGLRRLEHVPGELARRLPANELGLELEEALDLARRARGIEP